MRHWIAAGIATATLAAASTAFAADIARPVYKAPPVVVPAYSWSGCYVGGNAGWSGLSQSATTNPFPSPGFGAPAVGGAGLSGFGLLPTGHDLDDSGFIGGVHAGCNYQVSNWVFGIEGDYEWMKRDVTTSVNALATFPAAGPLPAWNMTANGSNDWLASLRGRIGVAWDRTLFYATGGVAWTDTSYTVTATGLASGGGVINVVGVNSAGSFGDTKTGWVLGGGIEYALGPNWLIRAEYLHYEFAGSSGVLPLVSTVAGAACAPSLCNWNVASSDVRIDVVRGGLTYKFDWGKSPVVAKY
jgi:outer membrane immunogenic protein